MQQKKSGLAITSLTLGIIGVVFGIVPILSQILGILAIVFGFISKNIIENSKDMSGEGMAIAGIILGFIAFFFLGAVVFFGF